MGILLQFGYRESATACMGMTIGNFISDIVWQPTIRNLALLKRHKSVSHLHPLVDVMGDMNNRDFDRFF